MCLIPMFVPSAKRTREQPAAQDGAAGDLARGDRPELAGEVGEDVGVFEQVKQVEHPPAAEDLLFERVQRLRLGLRVERRDRDPRLSTPGRDPHATRAAAGDRAVERREGASEALLEVGDESSRVGWLAQRGVVDVAVRVEVGG